MTHEQEPAQLAAMAAELRTAREEFLAALGEMDPQLVVAPGLAGAWSARELIAHLGYWAGHAAEALHHAEQGRTGEFGEDEMDVDERNSVVARVAIQTELATVRQREQAAFEALLTAVERADPGWLEERVAYGDSIEQVIRDDGADHYREHAADIRAWFSGGDGPDDESDDDGAGGVDDSEPDTSA